MSSTNQLKIPWYKNWSEPELETKDNYLAVKLYIHIYIYIYK